jgi:hypothetical protein
MAVRKVQARANPHSAGPLGPFGPERACPTIEEPTMSKLPNALVALLLTLAVAACGSSVTGPETSEYTPGPGSYTPGPGSYTPGPGSYTPGPGSYTPGPGSYTPGPGS